MRGYGSLVTGRAHGFAAVAVTLLLLALFGGAAIAADVAVMRIEYKVNGGLGQRVATQDDRVDVVTYVKNLGTEPVSGVQVSYVYVNQVTGFKWDVPGTYALTQIAPGRTEQSTVYSWRPIGVDAGRYNFEATVTVNGSADDVPCNSVFPRGKGDCADVDGEGDPASIAILTSTENKRLVQALFNDPDPQNNVRLPIGCIVSFASSGLSSQYIVPLANVGTEVLPDTVTGHERRGYMGYTWSGQWDEREDLLAAVLLDTAELGTDDDSFVDGLGARYSLAFQLDFGFLSDELAADANLADPVKVSIQVKLFDEDAINKDYNQFTIPKDAGSTLDVYTPVIKWLFPGCETGGSDQPLGVAPGLRTGQFEPRVYVPVLAGDGGYDLLVSQVTSKGLEILWRIEDLPDRVVGFAVDRAGDSIYLSCADGSVMAVQDEIFLGFDYDPVTLWIQSIGQPVSRPEIVGSGDKEAIAVASDAGLHLALTDSGGSFETVQIASPTGEAITISGAPLAVGRYAYFAAGEWIGRVDVEADEVSGSLKLLPVETITTDLTRSGDNAYVFFGTASGRLYALSVSEPMVSLARIGRSMLLQQAGAARVTSVDVITSDKGKAWLYASTFDGGIYRTLFDLEDGEFDGNEPVSLFTDVRDSAELPSGGLAGVSISRDSGIEDFEKRPVLSIGLDGELLAYDGKLEERLECNLWGEEDRKRRRPFRFDIKAPLSSWTAWEASNTSYLVLTSEETGQLYGLDLGFIEGP